MKYKILIVCLFFGFVSCKTYQFRKAYNSENALLHAVDTASYKLFLKTHLKNGNICIFKDQWHIDTLQNTVVGKAMMYDFNRKLVNSDIQQVPIDSVVIFETNKKLTNTESARIGAIAVLTAGNAIMAYICLSMPKACFGSCPTFYTSQNANNDVRFSDAEGFSSSVLPCFEKPDIDALQQQHVVGEKFDIVMKNEALETHCVDEVKLLVFPVQNNQRVFQSNTDTFFLSEQTLQPSSAIADEGDILNYISENDKIERFSLSDSSNLLSKEEIYVNFDHVPTAQNWGLVLDFRQTLMSTFLFYNTMGYMGNKTSDVYARIEKKEKLQKRSEAINKQLGGIEVFVYDEKNADWKPQGSFYELGPIAINSQIIPLEQLSNSGKIRIKLRLNKGTWRIDRVMLAQIVNKIEPTIIYPEQISQNGFETKDLLTANTMSDKYIISMPGDSFNFQFVMPQPDKNYEMFLYSEGYYIEWMRNEWLAEKDIKTLKRMYLRPKRYLKKHASDFKQYERQMEEIFWNSKITSAVQK